MTEPVDIYLDPGGTKRAISCSLGGKEEWEELRGASRA